MAKVVMTRYKCGVENRLVFPECPLAGKDPEYTSLEVICSKPTEREHYCSSMNEKGVCPMNPRIGDMRRAREMKEFVHKRKLQLSGAKNREVIPELRSIPLTFMDCEKSKGGFGTCQVCPLLFCNEMRLRGCPRGFQ